MKLRWKNWLRASLKLVFLIILLVSTFVFAMFQGGFVSWFIFYSFIPFAVYSILLSFYPLSEIKVSRTIKPLEAKSGDTIRVKVTLQRNIIFPLFYLVVEDEIQSPYFQSGESKNAKTILFPGFKKYIEWEYLWEDTARGEHTFTSVRLRTGDFFGLFEKERTIKSEKTILVYPSYVDLKYRPLENRYDQGMTNSNVNMQKDTTMVTGIRQYEPGDRFSWIHWKSFARTNQMMTKEFEERQSHDVLVILDRTPTDAFEEMVQFTNSITRAILKKGAQAGFLSIGNDRVSVPIRSGDDQQRELQYHLARVLPDSTTRMEKILLNEGNHTQLSATIILVTFVISKELITNMSQYARQKGAVVFFLVKKKSESIKENERALMAMASSRNMQVRVVWESTFESAFSEVKRA
jgi:uncharacterized protein (DUF58 family)